MKTNKILTLSLAMLTLLNLHAAEASSTFTDSGATNFIITNLIPTAEASSTYTGSANLNITVTSITNQSNPGVSYGNDIVYSGERFLDPLSGSSIIGAGFVIPTLPDNSLPSDPTVFPANFSFNQSMLINGEISNGDISSYYPDSYLLSLENLSLDTYIINYTVDYSLSVVTSGEFSQATFSIGGDNIGLPDDGSGGYIEVGSFSDGFSSSDTFGLSLTLAGLNTAEFYSEFVFDGVANATLATVPLPGAVWLFLAGLLALPRFKRHQ